MYAGTKVNLHEILQPRNTTTVTETLPLFLCVFSADKGSEAITDFTYNDFRAMYGDNADFFKYGQPLTQAHAILKAGGRVLGKRLVAPDATLANLIITAELTSVQENKYNAQGQQIYLDEEGNETTTVTDTPATITVANVKYVANTVENARTAADVLNSVPSIQTEDKFPLFVIMDNGRGTSVKRVRIAPDYDVSKTLQFVLYTIQDVEGTNTIETNRFSAYPDAITSLSGTTKNMALTETSTVQFNAQYYANGVNGFVNKLAEITGYTVEDLWKYDVLFGATNRGAALSFMKIDDTGLQLNSTYGLELQSGTNGEFGDAPFAGTEPTEAWTNAALDYFGGNFDDAIYDLDQYKIDFCCDANYPDTVKNKIVELANFREDFFYFRDMGLGIHSLADVESKISDELDWPQSCYVGDYMTSYDIIDDYSKKQVTVTMMHGLAPLLVSHYANNVAAPIAGEFNNFVITEAVDGTLNFTPRITPKVNQKELIDDMKVNYANYSSTGMLTIQSTYTSQDHWGPLSYSSNVIVTQMCIKDIRRYTPRIRFMLMDDPDFSKYAQLVQDNVIAKYNNYFKSATLIYTRDDEMIANKIFNASLYCYYKDFPQGEIFDVFAVEGSPDSNPLSNYTNLSNAVSGSSSGTATA